MDSNWNASQSGGATGSSSGVGSDSNANPDWRSQLQPDARQRIVNKMMDMIKRHLPMSVGINELQKIAVRFEEKIYSAATSQRDYLRKISLKMLSMENKTQPGLNPSLPNQNWMDPGATMDSNWNAPQSSGATGPSSSVGPDSNANPDWRSQLQPDARQRIVNKIMDTLNRHLPVPVPEGINECQNIAVRFEEKIYSAATSQPDYLRKISLKMLSMENKTQPGLNPSLPNQNWMDPGPSGTTGPGGPTGSLPTDMYSNTQRQQQLTPQNQMLYHQQQLVMRHKLQQQQQQQQQSLLQQTQMQMSSALAGGSGMMSAARIGGMQQSQQNSVQQQPVHNTRKSRKCRICEDCVHKRRNPY